MKLENRNWTLVLSRELIKNGFIAHDLIHVGSMMASRLPPAIVAQEEGLKLLATNDTGFEKVDEILVYSPEDVDSYARKVSLKIGDRQEISCPNYFHQGP